MTDQATALQKLQVPFPASEIGKLPRVTCKDCSDKNKNCTQHKKQRCTECQNWISTAHIHLDYVGHAEATRRFLEADPLWTWEPLALTEQGLPAFDRDGGLWIKLTIAGVTRLGYGDAQGKTGGNAIKEAVGDALRNGAMRFGVALDLWSKVERDENHPEAVSTTPEPASTGTAKQTTVRKPPTKRTNIVQKLEETFTVASEPMRRTVLNRATKAGMKEAELFALCNKTVGRDIDDDHFSVEDVNKMLEVIGDNSREF